MYGLGLPLKGHQLIGLPKAAVGAESSRDHSLYDMLGTCPHVKPVAQVEEFEVRSYLPSHLEKSPRRYHLRVVGDYQAWFSGAAFEENSRRVVVLGYSNCIGN
jgi:hypothetical protein